MKKKPVIGISTSTIVDQSGMFAGYHRTYVNEDYINSVIRAGGIPIMIPLNVEESVLKDQLELCDGLILSGGHDVYPLNYKQEPRQKLGATYPKRDEFEYKLIQFAKMKNIPILGICRGLQIINTYYGGTLHQDLSYIPSTNEVLKHDQGGNPELVTHSIQIKKESKLYPILGEETLVNSFHHQVIDRVADGFQIAASAADGCIEAIEKEDGTVMGVQWHPEMLSASNEKMRGIFEAFVVEASK